jgi:hypothetical protein
MPSPAGSPPPSSLVPKVANATLRRMNDGQRASFVTEVLTVQQPVSKSQLSHDSRLNVRSSLAFSSQRDGIDDGKADVQHDIRKSEPTVEVRGGSAGQCVGRRYSGDKNLKRKRDTGQEPAPHVQPSPMSRPRQSQAAPAQRSSYWADVLDSS